MARTACCSWNSSDLFDPAECQLHCFALHIDDTMHSAWCCVCFIVRCTAALNCSLDQPAPPLPVEAASAAVKAPSHAHSNGKM